MTIREYREKKKLTQPQLAMELKDVVEGIDAPLISKMEKGLCEPTDAVRAHINSESDVRMTQCERILEYMQEFGSITTLDAFRDLGVSRLSARIWDLKREGYDIEKDFETAKNRWGQLVSFARYTLKGDN